MMNQNNQQLIKASVVIVIVAGLLGAITVLTEGIGIAGGKLFAISLSLIIFGIMATISMVVTRKPEYKALGTAGIFVSGLAFILFAVLIIGEISEPILLKLSFSSLIASFALGHICLLHYFTLQNKYATYARMTATLAITIFSLFLIIQIFEPFPSLYNFAYDQSTLKVIVAALIVDLAATLLVPLCNRLKKDEPAELTFTKEEPGVKDEANS